MIWFSFLEKQNQHIFVCMCRDMYVRISFWWTRLWFRPIISVLHNAIWPEPFDGIDRTELDQSEASNFQITRIVLYWVYYMWLLCLHAECIIQWPCSNLAQTLLKLCSNFAQTSLKVRSNLAQISLKPHSNLTQTSLKPRSNLTQTSLKPHSHLAQTSLSEVRFEQA